MAGNPTAVPEYIQVLQASLDYNFTNMRYLVEALRAPGSGFNTHQNQHGVDGYRRLAQLGESLVQSVVIDDCYHRDMERGQMSELKRRGQELTMKQEKSTPKFKDYRPVSSRLPSPSILLPASTGTPASKDHLRRRCLHSPCKRSWEPSILILGAASPGFPTS